MSCVYVWTCYRVKSFFRPPASWLFGVNVSGSVLKSGIFPEKKYHFFATKAVRYLSHTCVGWTKVRVGLDKKFVWSKRKEECPLVCTSCKHSACSTRYSF